MIYPQTIKNGSDAGMKSELVTLPFTGPTSPEEAMARIDEAEQQEENGDVFSLEQVICEARQRIRLYELAHN